MKLFKQKFRKQKMDPTQKVGKTEQQTQVSNIHLEENLC